MRTGAPVNNMLATVACVNISPLTLMGCSDRVSLVRTGLTDGSGYEEAVACAVCSRKNKRKDQTR